MNKKTVKIIVITVAFILFYHIFLKDFLAYNQAKVKHTSEACEAYLSRFPNGYYVEDVRFIDIEITRNFGKIRKFKQLYAKSKYINSQRGRCPGFCDSINCRPVRNSHISSQDIAPFDC